MLPTTIGIDYFGPKFNPFLSTNFLLYICLILDDDLL